MTFIEFVKLVRPGYRWYKHCLILAKVLQRVADGEIKRLMIFMPPRHGKSELASRLFTAYFIYRYPERFVGLSSYSAGLAYTLSRSARENYLEAGGSLDGTANAVKQWLTGKGGGLWACGVGGEATGKGWHLGVIDDPLKNSEQASSEVIREKQKEWYGSTWYTREEPWSDTDPHGALIVINTRWHEDDLCGWLLSEEHGDEPERWHIVSFEAIKEAEPQSFPPTCTVEPDWREPGEALCSERRPLEKLQKICKTIGSYFWNALFQQRPRPKEGHKFKLSWFKDKFVGAAPVDADRVLYVDKAGTDGGGCFTALALLARDKPGRTFVESVWRGQWSALEREERIKAVAAEVAKKYGKTGFHIWLEQEGGSGGKESAEGSVRGLAGYTARAERVMGDKEIRAEPFAAQCEAGNVLIVEGDWNKAYLDELTSFPFGKYKDQVDASSGAFNKLAGKKSVKFY